MELLTADGGQFLLRWIHFLAGITWIGLLYYFNLVQVPFMGEADGPTKTGVVSKLVPRALWWFRWAAALTFLSGASIIAWRMAQGGMAVMGTSWGIAISIGGLLGTLMLVNVWGVIWPNQQIVIASNDAVAGGGQANPAAAGAGARAFLASRTNTLFSIPMLFFMAAASHLPLFGDPHGNVWIPVGVVLAVIALIEVNVFVGKKGEGPSKLLDKHVSVIHVGLGLALGFYLLIDLLA